FASLMGGVLPGIKQWDKAGGHVAGEPGPFARGWEVRPGDGDLLRGPAKQDESVFGCRGMALYGRELTRTFVDEDSKPLQFPAEVDPAKKNGEQVLLLRGKVFGASSPFVFEGSGAEPIVYFQVRENVGFRVVVEPRGDESPAP